MAGMPLQPVWRRAPLRAVRNRAWSVLVVFAVAVLATAAAAEVLVVSAWRDVATARVLDAVPDTAAAGAAAVLRVTETPPPGPDLDRLRARVDDVPGLSDVELVGVSFGDERLASAVIRLEGFVTGPSGQAQARLGSLDDVATRTVPVEEVTAAAERPDGVWLPESLALEVGAAVGDTVTVGTVLTGSEGIIRTSEARVDGVYRTGPGDAVPADTAGSTFWTERSSRLPGVPGTSRTSPLVLAEPVVAQQIADQLGDELLWFLDSRLDPAVPTRDRLNATLGGIGGVRSLVGQLRGGTEGGFTSTRIVTGLPDLAEEADDVARAAAGAVRASAIGAIVLGAMTVLAVAVLQARRRRRELEFLAAQGVRPSAVGLLTFVEFLLPALAGLLVGVPAAWLAVRALTGQAPSTESLTRAMAQAGGLVVLTLALAALLTVVTAARAGRPEAGTARTAPRTTPWVVGLLVATAAATAGLLSAPVGDARGLDLAVPAGVTASCGAVGALLLSRLLVVGRGTPVRRLTPASATGKVLLRRLAAAAGDRLLLLVVLAAAFGLAAHALTAQVLLERSIQDKTAVLAGAPVTVQVDDAWRVDPTLPSSGAIRDADVPAGDSVVYRGSGLLSTGTSVDVLVVDADRIAAAAAWGSDTGPLTLARAALPALAEADSAAVPDADPVTPGQAQAGFSGPPSGTAAPVLVVGDPAGLEPGANASVSTGSSVVSVTVVAVVPVFPGINPNRDTALIAGTDSYLSRLVGGDPRFAPPPEDGAEDGEPAADAPPVTDIQGVELWSSRPVTDVARDLIAGGLPEEVFSDERQTQVAAQVATRPRLVAADLAAPYLLLVAGLLLLIAVVALGVSAERTARLARPADIILARIGLGPARTRLLSWADAAGLVVTGLALGALGWLLTTPLLPRLLEPDLTVPPGLTVTPAPAAAALLVAAALAAVLLALLLTRSGTGLSDDEVLRDLD